MKTIYRTKGVCAAGIEAEVVDGIIRGVNFYGGCDGNLQAIARLVEGMSAPDAIQRLRGIRCGRKSTSCPDQLALALETMLNISDV